MEERGEEVCPDVALEVSVNEVTPVDGAANSGRREVFGGGRRRVDELFGGEGTI